MDPSETVFEAIGKENVRFLRLQFVDINGTVKNMAIPSKNLEDVLEDGIMFDGSSVEGYGRIQESDMMLRPDLSTFAVLPWSTGTKHTGRIICDVYENDGKAPFAGDPRYVLKRSIAYMKETLGEDIVFNVGPELEFYLLKKTEAGYVPHDTGGYFDYSPLDMAEDVRKDSALAMIDMGIDFEVEHHEVGAGQHEIDFKFGDALMAADNVITYKIIVKMIARSLYDTVATFMPKPFTGKAGNGMHTNQSLYDTKKKKNIFSEDGELSQTALYYINSLLKHAPAITAVSNPTVNSYKRLVPGYEAPVYISWGYRNRSSLVRIPSANEKTRRLELRSPDSSCNPYLAFAVMLSAGIDGIKNKIDPGVSVEENIYKFDDERRASSGLQSLPGTLLEALAALEADLEMQKALGTMAYKAFMRVKKLEWQDYSITVSPWEFDRLLNV
ncbi:MAG: glutamine synthetase beta-grasp domain-containing protein [Candidatus Methanofastidiosa archaeon]|nr:glutamine synthetase beta-grasp domain-containing protein [Candidatus Methanofastidiosa archaeon]